TEAFSELGDECHFVGGHDRLAACFGLGPYDRGAIALERQDGEGTGGEEMLNGLAVMRRRMRSRGNDTDLWIAPTDTFDASHFAQPRAFAVGSDEKLRTEFASAAALRANADRRCGVVDDALGCDDLKRRRARQSADERAVEISILDHVGACFGRSQIVVEAKQHGTKRGFELTVRDLDTGDTFSIGGKLRPDAENRQKALACGR